MTNAGIPAKLALPIHANSAGKLEIENPSVSTSAIPRAMDIVPRVATNGLIPRAVTSRPLTRPATAPTSKPNPTAAGIERPPKRSIATMVDDKAITDPTDRSKPPDASSMAIPITMIAIGVIPTDTARKLAMEKKWGDKYDITAMIRSINAISVSSRVSTNLRSTLCQMVSVDAMLPFTATLIIDHLRVLYQALPSVFPPLEVKVGLLSYPLN